jgi:hypothetical protein
VTDTHAPITGSHPAPMFDTGPLPALAPHTEPSVAPIFDTGPHPDPLRALGEVDPAPASPQAPAPQDSAQEPAPRESAPQDQGPAVEPESQPSRMLSAPQAFSELDSSGYDVDTDAFLRSITGHLPPTVIPAQPVVVASSYQFVKRWKFALIVAGVWLLAAAAGLGFYYWWYTALVKTIPVFGILVYLVVCMVASILVSMVPNRPQVTALAIALMAAPLASTAAAAVLHGAYFFEWIARPVIG